MNTLSKRILSAALAVGVVASAAVGINLFVNAETPNKLMNGSFEDPQISGPYVQYENGSVPYWDTTAYATNGTNGKIEFFRSNKGTYIPREVMLTPTDGTQAAELNADEESSLFQVVSTYPSTIYEWGLDHGARTNLDTLALIIGPAQEVKPSKASGFNYDAGDFNKYEHPPLREGYKYGRDQWMQMVDWLKDTGVIEKPAETGILNDGKAIVVYSKKFAEHGSFQNNEDGQPFSLKASKTYSEEWHIWLMSDACSTSEDVPNPWSSYGSNTESAETAAEETTQADNSTDGNDTAVVSPSDGTVDMSKYYLYTVPAGQTKTMFAFTSAYSSYRVDLYNSKGWKSVDPTYGNFLDNIQFDLYHPLTGSTTSHGTAVVGSSDGSSQGHGTGSHKVSVNEKLVAYATDGDPLIVDAVIPKENVSNVQFAGMYVTTQEIVDGELQQVTRFISLRDHLAPDGATDPTGQFIKFVTDDGDIVYKYGLENVSSSVDIHFVFVKHPMVTYDANGGKEYYCLPQGSNQEGEDPNVYSFKPNANENSIEFSYISPYVSHYAEAPDSVADKTSWRLLGWEVNDDSGVVKDGKNNLLLDPTHTVACNYDIQMAQDVNVQPFVIYNGDVALTETDDATGATFTPVDASATPVYDKDATGLTIVAQWNWRQAFIPRLLDKNDSTKWIYTEKGGSVIVKNSVSSDIDLGEAYNPNGGDGGKAYFSGINETIVAKATAKPGYSFEGWYDEAGNLLTINEVYSYTALKESVNTIYAHFSPSSKQHYIRQIKVGGQWTTTEDDAIGTLTVYEGDEAMGARAVCKATAYGTYKFAGWFDEDGNEIPDANYNLDRDTVIYDIEKPVTTYYARFEPAYIVYFAPQTESRTDPGTYVNSNTGGFTSITEGKYFEGESVTATAYRRPNFEFVGWYDAAGTLLSEAFEYTPPISPETDGTTYYARFKYVRHTVRFVPYTRELGATNAVQSKLGGDVTVASVVGRYSLDRAASSAVANDSYRFVGWYTSTANMNNNRDPDTNLDKNVLITGNATYYALFEAIDYEVTVEGPYTSFVKEEVDGDGDDTNDVPGIFASAMAGTGKNSTDPGRTDGAGNTIATGFKFTVGNKDNANHARIDITVPAGSYIKIGTVTTEDYFGNIPHEDAPVMTDSEDVVYNKGSIYKTTEERTISCYFPTDDLNEGNTYVFILDGLFTDDTATASVVINRETTGFFVTGGKTSLVSEAGKYRPNSHYPTYEKWIEVIISNLSEKDNEKSMVGLAWDMIRDFVKGWLS